MLLIHNDVNKDILRNANLILIFLVYVLPHQQNVTSIFQVSAFSLLTLKFFSLVVCLFFVGAVNTWSLCWPGAGTAPSPGFCID